jgi:penicillin-binding protein 1A
MGSITPATAESIDPLLCGDACTQLRPAAAALQAQHQQAILRSLHDSLSAQAGVLAPHFVAYVRDQLVDLFQDDPLALSGTLTVQTTLDLGIQQRAQAAVTRGVAAIGRNANNGALLMLDAHTGAILAMVGSAKYNDPSIAGEFNVVTAQRQPGSSFKPYVYEQAYREGTITMSTIVDDTQRESQSLGGVHDWDGSFMGAMPAWQALLLSRNVPTEQVMEKAGPANVNAFAHSLGITTPLADNASTAIGTSAVRMIDHAAAYAAFADGGKTVTPSAITRVTDSSGDVLYSAVPPAGATVMTPSQAYAVTGVLRRYNAQWHDGITRDVASKSGTTDNFTDAWFMAYTPGWVVATWVGHTSGTDPAEVGMNSVYGNDVGADLAAPFINGLAPGATFTVPPGSPSYTFFNDGGPGPTGPPPKHGPGGGPSKPHG